MDNKEKGIVSTGLQQAPITYIGREIVDHSRHDGGLKPVVGVNTYQVMRANKETPQWGDGSGSNYNHQPYLAYWNNKFYLEYLSCLSGESVGESQTFLTTSADGVNWDKPEVVFPIYRLPDGWHSTMHQRMGFYISKSDHLLVLGFYGICRRPRLFDMPNDGQGIGRVVREVYKDGTFGPIYIIRYNTHAGWNESNTNYKLYTASEDEDFKAACEELLSNKLMTQQWWEEDRSKDGFYRTEGEKALSYYHRKDGKVVGLWKWSKAALSSDEGESWTPVAQIPTFVMAGAKVWGQKTSDGRYAVVYNPTKSNSHRWPLAVVTGEDGICYDNMLVVNGEVSPRRYSGFCKDFGPQYVRGIEEGNGIPPDGAMWITYSMNKEDIWVSRIPVPVNGVVGERVQEDFETQDIGGIVKDWNIYSGIWSPVRIVKEEGKDNKCLMLADKDPYEYAKAERVFKEAAKADISYKLKAGQNDYGWFDIEVTNKSGDAAARMSLTQHGLIIAQTGKEIKIILEGYAKDYWYEFNICINCNEKKYAISINGETMLKDALFTNAVETVERLCFRTGKKRYEPSLKTTDHEYDEDLPNAGIPVEEAVYYIDDVLI